MYASELVRHVNYGVSVYKILELIGELTPIRFFSKTASPYTLQTTSENQYTQLDKEAVIKLYTTALCDSITADNGYINIFLK